ncbi:acetyltransferase component of pyruvate dehydrogenase complex [Iodidimonas nitroreducens]|uniref:Acetyltransferase component of pyruvate dehydrogenase complex n=1 Tax=Iodidimonas nitroreducens TaxID=1236968 RepID=A0A5A7N4J7_9PROT|nr:pyruvate dehydrogenase complex dihydrolipoamide acetyltransferase [Iodidimonas nitroreducens]GAK32896.1 dihydrolipoyllysine-residue acetyltransferase component of pyruvate dehydrogenase complex [alpha proteobacterium Q-1]GER03058.1 acetyltransferase component of pyruvate dehydrogenase complex [Iodidimonas nitroreducens]
MPIEILMPALSPTMEKGTLAKWLVSEGDTVASGDIIAEIETDKATMEVEAIDEGRVGKILISEGTEDVPVNDVIAILLEEGEDESALEGAGGGAKKDAAKDQEGAPKVEARKTEAPKSGSKSDDSDSGESKAPPAPETAEGERIFASPLARRLAQQAGLDLTAITGSGPKGRIIKADIDAAKEGGAPARADQPKAASADKAAPAEKAAAGPRAGAGAVDAPGFVPPADIPYDEVKLSGMRKVIAKRMTQSKSHVPHFYLTIDVSLEKLMAQRKDLNARLEGEGVKISVNDFIIRASALALKKVPAANAMFAGDKAYLFKRQDISVAVAIDGGLITPVIRDAGAKGLATISREMKDLATKARDGKLMPEDYQGGTFSISNLGMFGIREFGAVINPPQGAILAVGAGEKRAVVVDDAVAVKLMMSVTLAVDHRVLDGAIGAEFLAAFKGYIEDPMTMLL